MKAKASGEPYDDAVYSARVRSAVAESVRKLVESGLDIVNDGEQSKTGFAAYICQPYCLPAILSHTEPY
jgi:5-methyltetrahydropteroyltriglutamate--homocysteine methyltransferase